VFTTSGTYPWAFVTIIVVYRHAWFTWCYWCISLYMNDLVLLYIVIHHCLDVIGVYGYAWL